MDLISGACGFALGVFLTFVILSLKKYDRLRFVTFGLIELGDIKCLAGDTMLEIPFTTGPGSPIPVEVRAKTYDSAGSQPTWEDSLPQGTTSPIRMAYDPASCHDSVVVYGAFAGGPANGNIPCVGSGCSSSGSGVSETSEHTSVLP